MERDIQEPCRWTETFRTPTWTDYLRLHHRLAAADRELDQRMRELHMGEQPPSTRLSIERPTGRTRKAEEVVVVSIGPAQAAETLRTALAMGADRAVLVETEDAIEPLAVAKILKGVAEAERPGLVIVGKQAIDDDSNQTGQMLSALLGWAQATFASKVEIGNGSAEVTREVDGGLQTIEVKLPAVITTDLRLNEPRYASLPNIMKAKKKPLDKKTLADFGVDTAPRLKVLKTEEPSGRQAGVKVGSVAELVANLKTAGAL